MGKAGNTIKNQMKLQLHAVLFLHCLTWLKRGRRFCRNIYINADIVDYSGETCHAGVSTCNAAGILPRLWMVGVEIAHGSSIVANGSSS